jgi:hypothetical protein
MAAPPRGEPGAGHHGEVKSQQARAGTAYLIRHNV